MRWVLYANANEIDLREEGHISRTDFFCYGYQSHVTRTTIYKNQQPESGLYKTIEWGDPTPCNGSCRVWNQRNLDAPQEVIDRMRVIMLHARIPIDARWGS